MKDGRHLVWILDDEWVDHSVEKAILEQNGFEVKVTRSETLEEDLPQYAPYVDGVIVQVGFPCQAELINKLDSCRVITASSVGYNHIDVEAATGKGIIVSHVPEFCSEEVSDHTITHMLTITRRFPAYHRQVKGGKWAPMDTLPIQRFSKNTVGLLGFGLIARKVARKLKPFGVRIITHAPTAPQEVLAEYAVETVSFNELLKQSTILSLHIPLRPENKNIISYEQLMMMPRGSFIVNTSRGGLINEEDLYQAIFEGHIAGAGLDVLLNEPPNPNDPLLAMDEVFVTPHSGYISEDALEELKNKTCQNIIDGVAGKPLVKTLNSQVLNKIRL
ncbi:C-terminal binding protein [Bacillus sp. FJAT-29790]|uniref:C-terminal binding protein n=1 Tax=Bacillus sp. FJAT-29790 TaxID=1895002 RepID=UPI001C244FB6|nr:C-terminal binding protein [Bacillus sp. FJAT-29790]MBU8879710.1 C-terminal binding protein [Bacillus sp. FJAT-29790]